MLHYEAYYHTYPHPVKILHNRLDHRQIPRSAGNAYLEANKIIHGSSYQYQKLQENSGIQYVNKG